MNSFFYKFLHLKVIKLDFPFWHLLSMLYELSLWMHFKTEYQSFSNLVQEGLYHFAIPISWSVSYRHSGHDTQPTHAALLTCDGNLRKMKQREDSQMKRFDTFMNCCQDNSRQYISSRTQFSVRFLPLKR